MKFVIQCVQHAKVSVDGNTVGSIGRGYLVLAGIAPDDTRETADKLVTKMCKLRIFEDENGKTNLSLNDVDGELLIISQFTLYANCKKGNRPSFTDAAPPDIAEPLYDYIVEKAGQYVPKVERGVFGAYMQVELLNDGPFTVVLDSKEL
ncbi:MAG: D-tyrosyl-tRNA(Tyr) deacylase [Oscillospiraceae bacterium]|nr:D-tyrosyl-tRNA(Tyr) deacylase [Oscillospiraceae bacterium]